MVMFDDHEGNKIFKSKYEENSMHINDGGNSFLWESFSKRKH